MGWWAYTSMAPAEPFNGNGTIVILTFEVIGKGSTKITFTRSPSTPMLSGKDGNPLKIDVYDAEFEYAGAPVAKFTYWPDIGVVEKPILFNASESFDIDGSIKKYVWNFGDSPENVETVEPFYNHTYSTAGTYTVSLVVVDNEDTQSLKYSLTLKVIPYRDIKILDVYTSVDVAEINETIDIEVKIMNLEEPSWGIREHVKVALYYNHSAFSMDNINMSSWTLIEERYVNISTGEPLPIPFDWNTRNINKTEAFYYFLAKIEPLPYERNVTDNLLVSSSNVYLVAYPRRDLAVSSIQILASSGSYNFTTPIISGESAFINVKVFNNSTRVESNFKVIVTVDGSALSEKNITSILKIKRSIIVSFKWSSPSVGGHNVSASVYLEQDGNPNNNELTVHVDVIITPQLSISWLPKTPMVNETVSFTAAGSLHADPKGLIINYTWTFIPPGGVGYSITLNGENVTLSFPTEGNWTVRLVVTDNFGITYSSRRTATNAYAKVEQIMVKPIPPNVLLDYVAVTSALMIIGALVIAYMRRSRKLQQITENMLKEDLEEYPFD
jgi:PKD repeat protein